MASDIDEQALGGPPDTAESVQADAEIAPEPEAGAAIKVLAETDSVPVDPATAMILNAIEGLAGKVGDLADRVEKIESGDGAFTPEQIAAQQRLANDKGVPGPPSWEDRGLKTVGGEEGGYVELPTPSDEAKAHWARTAMSVMENIDVVKWGMSVENAVVGYMKGGPLWLAAVGSEAHTHLMSLPQGMRQDMVRSVQSYAPADAALLARDILRADTESAKESTYDEALKRADDRKAGFVPDPGKGAND